MEIVNIECGTHYCGRSFKKGNRKKTQKDIELENNAHFTCQKLSCRLSKHVDGSVNVTNAAADSGSASDSESETELSRKMGKSSRVGPVNGKSVFSRAQRDELLGLLRPCRSFGARIHKGNASVEVWDGGGVIGAVGAKNVWLAAHYSLLCVHFNHAMGKNH